MNDEKYKVVTIRKDDYVILKSLAEKTNRTISGMFAQVVEDWCISEASSSKSSKPQIK